ncbi:MAG: UbiA family prenyltransferase [Chloroflexota bacterium]|nr:UbiA family prenyltransferase [Chloroflexota bacterium]
MTRRLSGLLHLVHPFPSALNALLVVGLALVAGGAAGAAAGLGLAMLALQFSIGAFNDYCDAELDGRTKPDKPIPAGRVSRRTALLVAVICAALGLALAAPFGPPVLALAALMLGAGLAYDVWLKRAGWGWLAFAVAFPLVPIYAWYGSTGALPPRSELLLPVAALAGPALQLANGLTDLEADAAYGVVGLAGRLGRRAAVATLAVLQAVIHGVAWTSIAAGGEVPMAAFVLLGVASAATLLGVPLSASVHTARRQAGWHAQAGGVVVLALGWLIAVASPG